MKNVMRLWFAITLFCTVAFGQAVRIDQPLLTSGPNVPVTGQPLPETLWLSNATVNLCTHVTPPAVNTLANCLATPITTYTDSTEGTSCPAAAPLVELPGTTCSASAGLLGNLGFWYAGGTVDYFVTSFYGTYGPYSVSGGNGGGGGGGIPYPNGTGIPSVSSGTAWGATYNNANVVPITFLGNFIPGSNGLATGAFCTTGTTGSDCLQLSSGNLSLPSATVTVNTLNTGALNATGTITGTGSANFGSATNLIIPQAASVTGINLDYLSYNYGVSALQLGTEPNSAEFFPYWFSTDAATIAGDCIIWAGNGSFHLGQQTCASGGGTPGGSLYSMQYNNTSFAGVPAPAQNGIYDLIYNVVGSTAVPPTATLVGQSGRAITLSTSTDLVSYSDNATTIDHDIGCSSAVTQTLPTATTLGNSGFVYRYSNHCAAQTDTITPTTWTINGAANLSVPGNDFCLIKLNPNLATDWLADCAAAPGSSGLWSGLGNPTGPLSLSMGTDTSQFSYSAPLGGAFVWLNSTAATNSFNRNSPTLQLQGNYWNGSASANDYWLFGDSIGVGTNPSSTFTFTHTGSSGAAAVSVPGLIVGGSTFATTTATTLTFPTTSATIARTDAAQTLSGTQTLSGIFKDTANGAASAGSVQITGTPYSGGTAATTTGLQEIIWGGATEANLSTAGTAFEINAASGFTGDLINTFINGTSYFKVNSTGIVTPAASLGAATATSLACGVSVTTACIITGYGGTSGTATLTWPAVAGTTTNPIASSNTLSAPVFVSSGTTAGFFDLPQGTTSAAVAPCNTANSICFQAPTAVTLQLRVLAGTPATGFPLYTNSSGTMTETITPVGGTLSSGPALLGTYAVNAVVASTVANVAGHFTNLQAVTTLGGTCTTPVQFNVFDGTSNTGSTVTVSSSTQTKGNGTSTAQTLTFAAGDVIGIYISTAGVTCTTDVFIVSAQYSIP